MFLSLCFSRFWDELYNDRSVDRDKLGFKGAERLWVPSHQLRVREREHYLDNRVIEGSDAIRAPDMAQRDMLQKHLGRQEACFADEFFQMSDAARRDLRNGVQAESPGTPKAGDAQAKAPKVTPEKPSKPVNLSRDRPNLNNMIDAGINKVINDLKKNQQLFKPAVDKWRTHPEELKAKDRAGLSFLRTVQLRHEIVAHVMGSPELIEVIVPAAVSGSSSGEKAPSTPGSQMTGQADAHLLTEAVNKQKRSLKDVLQDQAVAAGQCWDGELEDLRAVEELRDLRDQVLDVDDAEQFLILKQKWSKGEKAAKQLGSALKASIDDLQKHLKSVLTEQTRTKKREAQEKEKEALRQVKQEAVKAANEIKKQRTAAAQTVHALFTADVKDIPEVEQKTAEAVSTMAFTEWVKPWCVPKCPALDLLLVDPPVQRCLASWGSQYKRAQASAKADTITFPMQDGQGKAEVAKVFETLMPLSQVVDVSAVAGGKSFMGQYWLYGCVADLKALGATPNSACLLKVHVAGDVRHVLFEIQPFLNYMHSNGQISDANDLAKATELLHGFDADALQSMLKDGGVEMFQVTLKPRQALFIPTGWLALEVALPSVHTYGIRKSFFLASLGTQYKQALESTRALGKNVDRMQSISKLVEDKKTACTAK